MDPIYLLRTYVDLGLAMKTLIENKTDDEELSRTLKHRIETITDLVKHLINCDPYSSDTDKIVRSLNETLIECNEFVEDKGVSFRPSPPGGISESSNMEAKPSTSDHKEMKMENEEEVFYWYLEAAQSGDAYAQYNLAGIYGKGMGVEKDEAKAAYWYEKAAESRNGPEDSLSTEDGGSAGNAEAQLYLGVSYANGRGVKKDEEKAVYWYEKAATPRSGPSGTSSGNAEAQLYLGAKYANGVQKDEQKAFYWYEKAAAPRSATEDTLSTGGAERAGSPEAQCYIGTSYAQGRGVEKDDEKAVYWYEKAAVSRSTLEGTLSPGFAEAQFNLGYMYDNGRGLEKDEVKAVYWYLKSAYQGYFYAQFYLGVAYAKGTGVQNDEVKAVYWYEKAGNQGHINAQSFLGARYADGRGVKKNEEKAFHWYAKAAAPRNGPSGTIEGNAEAQFYIGARYTDGRGVRRNRRSAALWYGKAAKQGHAGAQAALSPVRNS